MNETVSPVSDDVKLMTSIGHLCLQWALLEQSVLYIIFAIEDVSHSKGDIIYGGLDLRPRLNTAILLARYHKYPKHLIKRIVLIRDAISKEKLDKKRNTVVHGVQKKGENEGETIFYMPRLSGELKSTTLTGKDIVLLGNRVFELSSEGRSIFDDIGLWKFGDHGTENTSDNLDPASPIVHLNFIERIYARIKHFIANLKI